MKTHRLPLIVILLILGSVLVSACTGATAVNTWPGVSASQDTVYIADGGSLFAVNASNGSMAYRFPDKPDASKPFFAAPVVTDNLIIAGNYGHQLLGLNKELKQQWVFDNGNGHFAGSPVVVGDLVVAPSSDNLVYAVSLADGKLRWKYQTGNALWAQPASDGQLVFVPALDHNVYALKVADGSLAWKKDLGSALVSGPLLTEDGTLYISTLDGNVVALKAADGSIQWTAKLGGHLWATPVQNKDTLFVGNSDGKITAISAKDGKTAWQKDAGSPIIAGGALVPDGVVFVTEGGSVTAWPFTGEKQLWSQPVNGKLYSTPVVVGQNVVVAVTGGDKLLQAINENGTLVWPFVAPK